LADASMHRSTAGFIRTDFLSFHGAKLTLN
jgi:hypothetical protein